MFSAGHDFNPVADAFANQRSVESPVEVFEDILANHPVLVEPLNSPIYPGEVRKAFGLSSQKQIYIKLELLCLSIPNIIFLSRMPRIQSENSSVVIKLTGV